MYIHPQKEYDYLTKSASPTDCTGLIPEGTVEENSLASYQDVYHFGTNLVADVLHEDYWRHWDERYRW